MYGEEERQKNRNWGFRPQSLSQEIFSEGKLASLFMMVIMQKGIKLTETSAFTGLTF